jgi:pimeloyl-ACP methyl ester carboxylesterase
VRHFLPGHIGGQSAEMAGRRPHGVARLLPLLLVALLFTGCASSSERREPASPLAEAKSHFAKFGTNKVHYVVQGKGKHAIVLVHCWSGNLGFWREQVPALADKARIILIDLPGHGQSDKPHTAYTMDFFAGAVLAVMRDAHVDKATLAGHSMGTPVICRVCKQAPERVAALVAVDGMLRRPKMTAEQAAQFTAGFRAPDFREKTRQFMGTMFPIPGTEALRDRVVSEMLETPQYVMVGAMDGMFGADQPDWDLRHVNVPVLVINTTNPMWTDDYKEYVRSLSPQTDYHAIDGTGHWLMLEKPAEFNAALTDMLGKFGLIEK